MIQLYDFSVGYGSRRLLCGVNAVIPSGGLTALIGRNGAGKSTLLRAVAGLTPSYEGEIVVDGKALRDMSPQERAKTIAFVNTERVRVANLRCRDVVGMGRAPFTDWMGQMSSEDQMIVTQSLEAVGMLPYADRTLDSMSDGECQRVMIARALAQTTPVVLLDEPTSFLDLPNRYELCSLLRRLAHKEGKTIMFSTHELDIALRICDSIALIDSPHLHCLPACEMARSGNIERLFRNDTITFDPEKGIVLL